MRVPQVAGFFSELPEDLPPIPELPHRKLGERNGQLPADWLKHLPDAHVQKLEQLPVPDPHALLHRAPALFGATATLKKAAHVTHTWPEFEAFESLLHAAQQILDAEAGRLLGDPDAHAAIQNVLNSRQENVRQALRVAQSMLG